MLYLNHNQTGGIFIKVKIMDYETAKDKVLAEERNPCYANDKMVWVLIKLGLDGDKLETLKKDLKIVSVM